MKRDLCSKAVLTLRMQFCTMNEVPIVPRYYADWETGHERYVRMRLELAKRVLADRAKEAADDRRLCQAVLDKIDEIFLAEG